MIRPFLLDPYDAACALYHRKLLAFIGAFMRTQGITQITIDPLALERRDVIEERVLPDGKLHFRICGELDLEKK